MCGKEDLVSWPIEKLHRLRYVCADHFENKDLKKKATALKKELYKIQVSNVLSTSFFRFPYPKGANRTP
jgi:hypothetical protein